MLFVVRTQDEADKVAQIVSTLNLEREWYVVISWEPPDAEASRERNRAMRERLAYLEQRMKEAGLT